MIILHTITRGSGGGTMGALEKSISHERSLGHEVWIASGNPDNLDSGHLFIPDLKREISFFSDVRAFLRLHKILKIVNPDLVHSHESKAGALTRLLSLTNKKPVFVHTVHMATFHSKNNSLSSTFYAFIEKSLGKRTDFLVYVSPALRDIFESHGVHPKLRSIVVRSRVSIEKFAERRGKHSEDHKFITSELSLPNSSRIILSVGLLEVRKRPDYILDELAQLLTQDSSLHLVYLGEGVLKQQLEKRVTELNLASNVRFIGFRKDIEHWVSGADAIVLASTFEGFPQIALQSSAAGTPIIATYLEEYSGSTILRIVSPDESMAEAVAAMFSSDNHQAAADNQELEDWNSCLIDDEHEKLLNLVSKCAERR